MTIGVHIPGIPEHLNKCEERLAAIVLKIRLNTMPATY